MKRIVIVLVVIAVAAVAFWIATSPDQVGGGVTYVGPTGKIETKSLIVVSQREWDRKGKVRHIGHGITVQRVRSGDGGFRVEAEVHGDSKLIDKVVQGFGHFKLTPKAGDRTKVNDAYTGASASHRESWLWGFDGLDTTKGAGVSTTWCNGGVGPCMPVEYRYWRFTFHWKQGVSIFGQDIAHHKTLYIGCTLRANGTYQCGTGEA